MKHFLIAASPSLLVGTTDYADLRQLVDATTLLQIASETSGEAAKRNLDAIWLQHRMHASEPFLVATRFVDQLNP